MEDELIQEPQLEVEVEVEEEQVKIEDGDVSTFYIANQGDIFGIGFDSIFGFDKLKEYNDFDLTSKRNFKNLAPSLLETFQQLFLKNGEMKDSESVELIMYKMLDAKHKLMVNDATTFDEFLTILDSITEANDNSLLKIISKYVVDNYGLELDKMTKEVIAKKKKVNDELMFTDAHAKALIKIAYLYRILIPTISVYFTYNKTSFPKTAQDVGTEDFEDLQFEEIYGLVFDHLFNKFAEQSEVLKNKLYKLTASRIARTAFTDKKFWNVAKSQGITIESETLSIYVKLLTNAISKLSIDADKNIISFLQSVVNNQIDFIFKNKFKYRFNTLGSMSEKYSESDDDNRSNEYEKLETSLLRKDEGVYILRRLTVNSVLDTLPKKLGVEVSEEEIMKHIRHMSRHTVQERIVAMLSFKYFEDKSAIKIMKQYEYAKLVLLFTKYLEKHKYIYLPKILIAKCEKHKERTNISGKRIRPLIFESKKYQTLFEIKYKNFSEEIERPLSAIIGTTYSSIFTDIDGNEIFDSTVKVGKIADELLDLAYLV